MGAVFAGAARAPITAVIIMFELTGEYTIILPLMVAIVLATGVSHLLSPDTIYTLKLRRRGVDLDQPPTRPPCSATVAQVMDPSDSPCPQDTRLLDAAGPLSRSRHGNWPILDDPAPTAACSPPAPSPTRSPTAGTTTPRSPRLCELPATVNSNDRLDQALDALETGRGAVPVLDPDQADLVGWLTHQRVLAAQL